MFLAKPIGGLLRWFIKPKIDNTKPLLVFYHADNQLNTIVSLMDEWSGNGNFEALMTRLRTSQQELLSALVMVMNGMNLPDSGIFVCRDYQLKYPDDVREEVLGYYAPLWFGAECIAAGSVIANKEESSIKLRPSAIRLCKVIEKLRRLLRKQVFIADNCYTHEMIELMSEFDQCWTEFELGYVSSWVKVKTPHEYNQQQDLVVIFSCAVLRALEAKNITQDMIDFYEPGLMYAIPRLGLLWGLRVQPFALAVPDTVTSDVLFYFHTAFEQVKALKTELMELQDEELEQLEKYICAFLHEEDQPPPWLRSVSRQASEVDSPKGIISRMPSLSLVSIGSETVVAATAAGPESSNSDTHTRVHPHANQAPTHTNEITNADGSATNAVPDQTCSADASESETSGSNYGNAAYQENGLPLVEPAEPIVTLSAAVFGLISRQGAGDSRSGTGQLTGNMPFAHHTEQSESRLQSTAPVSGTHALWSVDSDTQSIPPHTHTPAWNMSLNPNARGEGSEPTDELLEEEGEVGSFKEQYEHVLRSGSIPHARDEVMHVHVRTQRAVGRKNPGIKTGSGSGDESENGGGMDLQRSASEGCSEKSGISRSSSEMNPSSSRSLDRIDSEREGAWGNNSEREGAVKGSQVKGMSEHEKTEKGVVHTQREDERVSSEHDIEGFVVRGTEPGDEMSGDEMMVVSSHMPIDTTESESTGAEADRDTNTDTNTATDTDTNTVMDAAIVDRHAQASVTIRTTADIDTTDTQIDTSKSVCSSTNAPTEMTEDHVDNLGVYRRGSLGKGKHDVNRPSGTAIRVGMHAHAQVLSPAFEHNHVNSRDIDRAADTLDGEELRSGIAGDVRDDSQVHRDLSPVEVAKPGTDERNAGWTAMSQKHMEKGVSDARYQRLFLQIAQIADHLQSGEYAKDVRTVLKTVFAMHMSEDSDDESDDVAEGTPEPGFSSSQLKQGESGAEEADFPETNVYRDIKSESGTNGAGLTKRPVVATEDIEANVYGGIGVDEPGRSQNTRLSYANSAFVHSAGDHDMPVSEASLMDTGHSSPESARGRENTEHSRRGGNDCDKEYSGVSPPGIAGVCETLGPALALSAEITGLGGRSPELQPPQLHRGESHSSVNGEVQDTSIRSSGRYTNRNMDDSGSGSEQGSAGTKHSRAQKIRSVSTRGLAHLESSPCMNTRGSRSAANNSHNMSNMNTMCGPTQGLNALLPGGANTPMRTMYLRPEWMNDEDVTECARCEETFNWTRRRHHCRSCGGIFCASCASNYVTIDRLAYTRPVRVCGDCYICVRSLVLAQNNQNASR